MPVSMETKKSQQRFTKEFKIEAVKQVTGKRYRGQTPYFGTHLSIPPAGITNRP
jgi:hypothetical protein